MKFDPNEHPHRRYNPLTGEWVLVSPHRAKRPWQGQVEKTPAEDRPAYDPGCYLCPGNARASGEANPDYKNTFVFTNDFAAILPDTPDEVIRTNTLRLESIRGTCRVICFSPRHDLSLPEMDHSEIRIVIDTWSDQIAELGRKYRWVQVFENKGAVMGSSMPHPHGQIWALNSLPNEPFKEDRSQRDYFNQHGTPLLIDYLNDEISDGSRIVFQNGAWLAVVPYWAIWPFEILLLPKRHVARFPDLLDPEREALSSILKILLTKYDNLFETSFPYSMGWHGAPFGGDQHSADYWQLHAHFYPPLLRSATVKKFMVGFEMLAEAQRDLTAEQAAERLRAQSQVHYKEASHD